MSKQVEFDVSQMLKDLDRDLKSLSPRLEEEINGAIKDAVYATYAYIQSEAQSKLHSTRQDYLKGLNIEDLGDNSYVISLDSDWANKIEDGWPSFDQTPGMLASKKTVEVGRRSGQPWVHKSEKDGHKFAYVPFQRSPFSKEAKSSDLASAIKKMVAVNSEGRVQKITKIFNNPDGTAIEGKAVTAKSDNPLLDSLVKYQHVYKDEKTGKETVQSVYINYRCVSEHGKPWINGGYEGLSAFSRAEAELVKNINQIIQTLT